ncbi:MULTISPECIES: phosphatase PAP2 family protein [unclassified Enterococcus]|jgi:undecaprenyl-diphosphatase|uniref:phosphatase PAP2 family protein n=1 Tax=unclassified Enterococcus TaxID=2608891 RepID=UPI0006B981F4|nr:MULTISPECIES: phosphatase PAP2 family protein [unclassified Enterococcus]KPG70310.1 phospholipid phosphatase [Enterococcus sp. RIT-PI-f]
MQKKLYYQYAGSCFLLLFVFLGYIVKFYPSWLNPFDESLTRVIRSGYPLMTPFFLWVTKFANPVTIILLFLVVLVVFLINKYYAEALWLSLGTIGIAGLFNPLIKLVFLRERPTLEHLVVETSSSFPSGHSTGSMVFYGTLLLLVPILFKQPFWQWCLRILLGLLILLIGISRIYVGVHFPSDVLGGFCVGLSWLLLTYPYYLQKRFVWRFTRKQL